MLAFACRVTVFVLIGALAGCGGGGGGGGGSASSARGAFTLSATSVSINAKRYGPPPAAATLQLQLTGSDVATVGAAYREGFAPAHWLAVNITGSGNVYTVSFAVNTTALPPITLNATVSVGTADAAGNILQYKDVQVSYSLRDGVSIVSSPIAVTATLGHSVTTFNANLSVVSENLQWAVTANVPWISTPAPVGQGSGTAALTIDTSTLGIGTTTATVTATNTADPTDRATRNVSVTVNAPALVADPASTLQFGGVTGLTMAERTARLTLATGSRAHPWTAAFIPTTGANWLEISNTSGTLSDAGVDLVLTPRGAASSSGSYTGNVVFTANVDGTLVTRSLPVALNVDAQRIWASANGVGLSSFPGRQTLTRTLRVFNSQDRGDLSLQVSSDQGWLQASAPDGQSVVLTAAPGALAMDQFHTANVTVSSNDPLIVNQEVVRVGLWRGSIDPAEVTAVTSALYLAAHPIEPLVFANDLQGTIQVSNTYTGAPVRTLPVGASGPMTLSTDGSVLYVSDQANMRLIAVDPQTGATLRSYQVSGGLPASEQLTLAYARPDAHPILISGWSGEAFDEQSGARLAPTISGKGQVLASKDGRRVYVQSTQFSPARMSMTEVRYSTLNSAGLVSSRLVENSGHLDSVYSPGFAIDIALTEDDANLYRVAGTPHGFGVVDPLTLVGRLFLQAVAFPAAIECGWRGYCFGTAGPDFYTDQDLWIYDANQQYVGGRVLGSQNLYRRGLVLSADNTRLIAGLTVPSDQRRLKFLNTPQ